MKTLFKSPDDPWSRLQKAGETCASCQPFWEHQSSPAMEMVYVRTSDGEIMETEEQHQPIVVCPHCDGDMILRLSKE